jgi:signal transduction histidine kinase
MRFRLLCTDPYGIRSWAALQLRRCAYGGYVPVLTTSLERSPIVGGMAEVRRRRVTGIDILLTGALLLAGLFGAAPAAANQHVTPAPAAYVLIVAACLPVLIWRIRPLWTMLATSAVTLVYLGLQYPYGPIMIALAVAIFGMALRTPVRQALTAIGGVVAASGLVIGAGVIAGSRDPAEFISMAAWLVIPAAVGITIKARRDAAAEVRREQATRAVSEERLRLAQEVHDVAGHGFAVIAMQAGVALRVLDQDPAAARSALEGIRSASKEALGGLRAEIEALRRDAPLRPASGVADLPALVDRIRSSGLPVTIEAIPDTSSLPAEVDRAAYRIVQESLTNVLRHAGAEATARVGVRRDGVVLRIEIIDTGRGGSIAPVTAGRGIDGMRTRAEELGGTLDAGPLNGGGFAVRARLPLPAGARSAGPRSGGPATGGLSGGGGQ